MINYSIPNIDNSEVIADWIELYVTVTEDSISKADVGSLIEKTGGSEPEAHEIDSIFSKLEYRISLYGEFSPISIKERLVESQVNWKDRPDYLTCLIFSLEGNSERPSSGGMLFERLSKNALSNYLQGEGLIFGFPEPNTVKDIADTINEDYVREPLPESQDRGLDVVVWRPIDRSRPSQLIILTQCAAGQNWKSKLRDLSLNAWTKYIHFACNPLKGFCIPVVITKLEQFTDHSFDGGLLFDRPRIFKYTNLQEDDDPSLLNDLIDWCQDRMTELNITSNTEPNE